MVLSTEHFQSLLLNEIYCVEMGSDQRIVRHRSVHAPLFKKGDRIPELMEREMGVVALQNRLWRLKSAVWTLTGEVVQ